MMKLLVLNPSKSAPLEAEVVPVTAAGENGFKCVGGADHGATLAKLAKAGSAPKGTGGTRFVRFGGGSGKQRAENLLFSSLGALKELDEEKLRVVGGQLFRSLGAEKVTSASLDLDALSGAGWPAALTPVKTARALAEGLTLGAYEIPSARTAQPGKGKGKGEPPRKLVKFGFKLKDAADREAVEQALSQVEATAECVNIARDWSNAPPNVGIPEYYAAEAVKLARKHGIKAKVLGERDCAREKMGLFLAVGQGSEREGKVVVLEYTPRRTPGMKTLALVGKGITFDSGGISIKPSLRMEEMKHDMTGAATVMAATLLAARWGVKNRIVAIMAFTENMPSGTAIVPGSVIRSRNGKTVEIINTDAEGRLILADVLDYAHQFRPDAIVNIATLTGAVGVALGKMCAGLMGNDQPLLDAVRKAGDAHGERTWQLPMWDEYFEDMKSPFADMRNSCNDGSGGTIRGGIFLKQFIKKGQPWAHLDIAATGWGITHLPYLPTKGASGLHVRTLARLAADL